MKIKLVVLLCGLMLAGQVDTVHAQGAYTLQANIQNAFKNAMRAASDDIDAVEAQNIFESILKKQSFHSFTSDPKYYKDLIRMAKAFKFNLRGYQDRAIKFGERLNSRRFLNQLDISDDVAKEILSNPKNRETLLQMHNLVIDDIFHWIETGVESRHRAIVKQMAIKTRKKIVDGTLKAIRNLPPRGSWYFRWFDKNADALDQYVDEIADEVKPKNTFKFIGEEAFEAIFRMARRIL